jgi:tetratricopeptide (TPR) repeat protein
LALSVVLLSFAVLMSQSRGGVLAWSLAAVGLSIRAKLSGTQLLVVTSVLALAVGVTLGNEKLRGRWLAFLDGGSAESRLSLWVNGSRALGEDFIFGTGQGTFRWVEGRYRTNEDPRLYSEHAHNEYLDALVEGGVLRLGLTVFFLVRVLRLTFRSLPRELSVLARGYLYGTQFGLVVLVLHSAVDFGIHMPAVAVLATVSLIFAEHHLRRSEHVPPESESGLQPYSVVVVPGLLAAFLLFGSAWTREAADAFRRAGIRLPRSAVTQRILLAEQRCRLLPTDSQPLYELAIAHLDAADRRGPECHAAVGGGPMLFLPVEMRYPREIQRQHLEPALRALRSARMLHPMSPEVQAELALFAPFFMKADPPGMYAERALRLLPSDAQMHRIAAVSAWEQQDFARAHKHWQQALTLNRALLPIIVRDLGKRVPQKDWINIVGVNPASLGDLLRMSSFEQKIHDEILERIVQLPAISQDDRLAQARAAQKLGRTGEAIERWNQLIQENPRKREYRQEFLLWLEAEELYLEALPHLEWLIGLQPNHRELLDRLKFVQHGAKLQKFLRE